jgi:hypothetical protein
LLAIADLAGGEWARKARDAAKVLSGDAAAGDDDDGVELLHDIRAAFDATALDPIFTKELLRWLEKAEGRPWAAYGRSGKPIIDRQVAKLLSPFDIIPDTVHRGQEQAKGYKKDAFAEAWERYPKPKGAAQPYSRTNATGAGTSEDFASVREADPYGCEKNDLSNNGGPLYACTDKSQKSRREAETATPGGGQNGGGGANGHELVGRQISDHGEDRKPPDSIGPLAEVTIHEVAPQRQ